LYHALDGNVMVKSSLLLFLFIFFCKIGSAQKLVTDLLILNDSTLHRFTDINELYFLYDDRFNSDLKKLVFKLSKAKNQTAANALIEKIAKIRSQESTVILTLDYFFKTHKPVAGTNVEKVLHYLQHSNAYYLVNKYYLQNAKDTNLPKAQFCKAIQDTLAFRYGYGAFYYLTTQDSIYIAKMKKHNVDDVDEQVAAIIEKYLAQQQKIFRYDADAIQKEVLQIDKIKDAQWDRCLVKTDQLPNWDNLGVVIIDGKDTIERVYTIQYGYYKAAHIGKRITLPWPRFNSDVMWNKGAKYGLHYVQKTRKQCEENARRREEYNTQ
jgi:hypothetical protein